MKHSPINDPIRNPFHNRFNVPVHSRLDEMQAYTHMVWLNSSMSPHQNAKNNQRLVHPGRALAGAFAIVLLVVFSAMVFYR